MKDNILMWYLGMGCNNCHTTWSKIGKKKSIATLEARLIKIIKMTKGRLIPDQLIPTNCGQKRKELPVMGHLTSAVVYINEKAMAKIHDFHLK